MNMNLFGFIVLAVCAELMGTVTGESVLMKSIESEDLGKKSFSVYSSTPTAGASNISQQCIDDSEEYIAALVNQRSKWAIEMYESTGKLLDGLLYDLLSSSSAGATHYDLGLFDQCLSVRGSRGIRGKYCSTFFDIEPEMTSSVSLDDWKDKWRVTNIPRPKSTYDTVRENVGIIGFCIPSSCSALDLRSAVAEKLMLLSSRNMVEQNHSIITISTDDHYCHTDGYHNTQLDGPTIAMIAIIGLVALLVLLATLHEAVRRILPRSTPEAFVIRALHCFSAIKNSKVLFSTGTNGKDNLSCLHGIKVLTALWIILHHFSNELIFRHIYNKNTIEKEKSDFGVQFIVNGVVTVDTFFMISGLLVAYSLLRDLDNKKGRFNILLFYIHRFIRLTPVYFTIFGFIATLSVYVGSGPDWNYVRYISQDCRATWWQNFLYINNYMPVTFCMTESWYLACDMQMFLLCPLFIYPIWRWRRFGFSWIFFSLVALLGVNLAAHIIWNLPPTIMPTRLDFMRDAVDTYGALNYLQTYTRLPPYLLGILIGWVLHSTKKSTIQLNKVVAVSCWLVSAAAGMVVIFGLVPYLNEELVPVINPFVRLTYGTLHHIAWAAAIGWVVFACVRGYGGLVDRVLSWKIFVPLGRLTYVVYLVHFNFIKIYFSTNRKPIYADKLNIMTTYLGIVIISFVLAGVISIAIEMPFINLDRLLFSETSAPEVKVDKKNTSKNDGLVIQDR